MGGPVSRGQRPLSWQDRYRVPILIVTLGVVVGAVVSISVRTSGSGDDGWESITVLVLLALPSIISVLVTIRWRVWTVQCALAVAAWGLFVGPTGDLSCTDCGFALLIPLNLAVPQGILLLVGFLIPSMRRRANSDGRSRNLD